MQDMHRATLQQQWRGRLFVERRLGGRNIAALAEREEFGHSFSYMVGSRNRKCIGNCYTQNFKECNMSRHFTYIVLLHSIVISLIDSGN